MAKERVYQLFEEYFSNSPLLHVWEVGTDIVFGSTREIGYKLLTEVDPLPLLNDARNNPRTAKQLANSRSSARAISRLSAKYENKTK